MLRSQNGSKWRLSRAVSCARWWRSWRTERCRKRSSRPAGSRTCARIDLTQELDRARLRCQREQADDVKPTASFPLAAALPTTRDSDLALQPGRMNSDV